MQFVYMYVCELSGTSNGPTLYPQKWEKQRKNHLSKMNVKVAYTLDLLVYYSRHTRSLSKMNVKVAFTLDLLVYYSRHTEPF